MPFNYKQKLENCIDIEVICENDTENIMLYTIFKKYSIGQFEYKQLVF